MTLTKCPACGHDVSNQAISCPNCGQPLVVEPIQTIQLTKKKWKKLSLVAVALIVLALYCMANNSMGLGFMFLFFAFIVAIIANVGAWWSTG